MQPVVVKWINGEFTDGMLISGFQNIVDELLDKGQLIPLRSKMNMPRLLNKESFNQRSFWQIINIALPLLLIIIFGLVNQYLRRKKYE